MDNILITGASGFIGTYLTENLKDDFTIKTLSLRGVSTAVLDMSNTNTLIHLAGIAHRGNIIPSHEYFDVNYKLTIDLAKKAKVDGVEHFIFFSTIAVYGYNGKLGTMEPIKKDHPTNPATPYSKSKLMAEKELLKLEDESFRVTIIRPPFVYGPGAKGNYAKLKKLIKLLPLAPLNYDNKRSMVHINHLCNFTKFIIKNKMAGTFVPQDTRYLTLLDLANIIKKESGAKCLFIKPPKFIIKLIAKIKPDLIQKLYGELTYELDKLNCQIKSDD